jgi:hypothetical protein
LTGYIKGRDQIKDMADDYVDAPLPSMMQRRGFLHACATSAAALTAARLAAASAPAQTAATPASASFDDWIKARHARVISAERIEGFLRAPPNNQWAKFDAELGYVPSDSIQRDGIDGSNTVYRYGDAGERRTINYAERRCRINTYGNSFTQCHQVSDGETWQEALAAHLGEPVRNFGVGGYGVFQAFARLRRMERMPVHAPYLILNIYDNDHERSVMPWRGFLTNYRHSVEMYHGNPWTHLRVNLDSGAWEEAPNPCPAAAPLRELVSLEGTRTLVAQNEIVHLRAMVEGVPDVPRERVQRLADWAKMKFDFTDADSRRVSATELNRIVSRASTLRVMEKLHAFATAESRRLLVLLSYGTRAIQRACDGGAKLPDDVALLRWCEERGIPAFDIFDAHVADFAQFRISSADYIKRLFIGHYSPAGNNFFATAIRKPIVDWLDPKPIAYRGGGSIIDFQDGRYLDRAPGNPRKR